MRYWLPPILWTLLIFAASTDVFSASHTGSILETWITSILGHPLAPETFERIHFLIRKSAHLTEYGILGALLFRAIRGARTGWRARWAGNAIVIAAIVASIDEWHQTFVPSRTGNPADVVIDAAGALIAQVVIRVVQVLLFAT